MPSSENIFKDADIRQRLSQFSPADLDAVESGLQEKNGKCYLTCQVTNKDKQAKPEEVIRQLWVYRLLTHYGYAKARLTVEYPITFGRDSSSAPTSWCSTPTAPPCLTSSSR